MTLILHNRFSVEAAVAEFEGEVQFLCDGQFAVLPNVVLDFVTCGSGPGSSCLRSASYVTWKPDRLDYAPEDEEYTWLPEDVRETWDRTGPESVRLRQHHLFLRGNAAQDFAYVGEAHLGSYGGPMDDSPGERTAEFELSDRIPRDLWLECGGYTGWQIDVNHGEHILAPGDTDRLEELLNRLGDRDYAHFSMTRYEEDSLTIHTNPRRAWLMYLREPTDSGLYLDDPTQGEAEEHFECVCGVSLDFPASQTTLHPEAVQIAKNFFLNGELDPDMEWIEW